MHILKDYRIQQFVLNQVIHLLFLCFWLLDINKLSNNFLLQWLSRSGSWGVGSSTTIIQDLPIAYNTNYMSAFSNDYAYANVTYGVFQSSLSQLTLAAHNGQSATRTINFKIITTGY